MLATIFISNVVNAKSLNIYSHRQPYLLKPFIDAYTKKTGVQLNVVYSSKGLAQRLAAEGANSPADLILTVDIARLYRYEDLDLLAKIDSKILIENIPPYLRSKNNTWFGLSKRTRVIAVSKDKQVLVLSSKKQFANIFPVSILLDFSNKNLSVRRNIESISAYFR